MAQEKLISIVDDDESLRTALVRLVRSFGYRTAGFGSAEAFFADPAAAASACIVTDIHLPGLTGFELKRRWDAAGGTAPVIMITARNEAGLGDRVAAGGASGLLLKPFAPEALIACLEKALAAR